jgi:hypothetical protein
MARLWYGGTPADFAIAQGAEIPILDEFSVPTGDEGTTVVLPLVAIVFDAFLDAALSLPTTDLLDGGGNPITQVTSETDFNVRGTLPRFQGPNNHEGPLWLSSDATNGYRLEPESGPLWDRTDNIRGLSDVSDTAPNDNQIYVYDSGTGLWTPEDGPVVTSIDWADITNKPDIPSTAADVGAIASADEGVANGVATLDSAAKVPFVQLPTGTGATQVATGNHAHSFPSSALPAGSVMFADGTNTARPTSRTDIMVIWTAPAQPVNALNNVDIWLNLP